MASRDRVPWRDKFGDLRDLADVSTLFRRLLEWTTRLKEYLYFKVPHSSGYATLGAGLLPTSTTPVTITIPNQPSGAKGAACILVADYSVATSFFWIKGGVSHIGGTFGGGALQSIPFEALFDDDGTFGMALGGSPTITTDDLYVTHWIY